MEQRYALYVEDSGTKEYASNPAAYKRKGNSRYFVFGGMLLTNEAAGRLTSELVRLKLDCFGTEAVEVKSNWLRIPYEREKRYLEAYGISEARLTEFVDDYYKVLDAAELTFLAAVVDKVHMQEDYAKPWYAPAVAYEVLLQRVQNELMGGGGVRVTIDDMTGATPYGNQFKANLTRQHAALRARGSALMKGFAFPCLRGKPAFVNSAHSHLVQVADIVSYNVNRQFIEYGDKWEERGLKTLPTYGYLDRVSHKFRKDSTGRIQGYGIVKFPMRERIRWGIV